MEFANILLGFSWEVTKKSELPRYLHFEDYSDLSISREFKRAAVNLKKKLLK
jgi:hypothetical protein